MKNFKELKFILRIILLSLINSFFFYSGFLSFFSLLIPLFVYFKYGNLVFYYNVFLSTMLVSIFGGLIYTYIYIIFVVYIAFVLKYFFKDKILFKQNVLKAMYFIFTTFFVLTILLLVYTNKGFLSTLTDQISKTLVFLEQNYFDIYKQILIQFPSRQALIDKLVVSVPAVFIVSIAMYILSSVFIAINLANKNRLNIKKLIFYRVSNKLLWPAIVSGAFFVFSASSYSKGLYFKMFSYSLFYVFLLIYFFQGIGVLISYLSIFVKKYVFIQSFILVFVILSAGSFLSLLGFFDVFFDFRKKIIKGGFL